MMPTKDMIYHVPIPTCTKSPSSELTHWGCEHNPCAGHTRWIRAQEVSVLRWSQKMTVWPKPGWRNPPGQTVKATI